MSNSEELRRMFNNALGTKPDSQQFSVETSLPVVQVGVPAKVEDGVTLTVHREGVLAAEDAMREAGINFRWTAVIGGTQTMRISARDASQALAKLSDKLIEPKVVEDATAAIQALTIGDYKRSPDNETGRA